MPSRLNKNARTPKSARRPVVVNNEPLVDVDTEPEPVEAQLQVDLDETKFTLNLQTLLETLSDLAPSTSPGIPFYEEADDSEDQVPVRAQAQEAAQEREPEDAPPIPIPVPRSQTPQHQYTYALFGDDEPKAPAPGEVEQLSLDMRQLSIDNKSKPTYDDFDFGPILAPTLSPAPAPASAPNAPPRPARPAVNHVHTAPPSLPPQSQERQDPYSYGYGHGHSPSQTTYTGLPSPRRQQPSALARTIRAAVAPSSSSPSPARLGIGGSALSMTPGPGGKRFAPPPSAAVPVVDLGTAQVPVAPPSGFRSGSAQKERGDVKGEEVLWARWDEVCVGPNPTPTRLLIVAYPSTLRVWDCTDLEGIAEVLRVRVSSFFGDEEEERRLVCARILPPLSGEEEGEGRPWIGLGFDNGSFLIYSLKTHRVLTRCQVPFVVPSGGGVFPGAKETQGAKMDSFEASGEFIVISTTSPPALHVYAYTPLHTPSTPELQLLTEIPGARLALYPSGSDPASSATNTAKTVGESAARVLSSASAWAGAQVAAGLGGRGDDRMRGRGRGRGSGSGIYNNDNYSDIKNGIYSDFGDEDIGIKNKTTNTKSYNNDININVLLSSPTSPLSPSPFSPSSASTPTPTPQPPKPVYALSHRLLAYASTSTAASAPGSSSTSATPVTATITAAAAPTPSLTTAQAELMRVGGSVWGGMRTLGGLAVSAARSRIGSGSATAGEGTGGGGGVGRFFSRSAPEGRERGGEGERVGDNNGGSGSGGGRVPYVTIVDLGVLLRARQEGRGGVGKGHGHGKGAEVVVEFPVEKDRPLARIGFTPDGCSVAVVPRDGQGVRVYQVRPRGLEKEGSAWQMYHLRRGRTGAVVEGLGWSRDGRWAAVGTRKGTVHVFGVNPYGGKMDVRSHWEGRVRNVEVLQPMPTEMGPIVRMRVGHAGAPGATAAGTPSGVHGALRAPLAFTFIDSSEASLPTHLLPAAAPSPPPPSHPRSYSSQHAAESSPPSPSHALTNKKRATNFQDVLLFDPGEKTLALRRVVLEMRAKDQGMGMGMGIGAGVTSISLPGMGFAGALSMSLSSSPSSGGAFGHRSQGSRGAGQQEVQMELGGRESTVMTWSLGAWRGGEVRKILGREEGGRGERGGRADWLAQAELSTCSKSSKILPRPIYLSHQFSFHTLGEDYHALIRRYQLDIGGHKIDVRREVQVSAYAAGAGAGGGESFVEGFASPRDIRHHRTLSASFDEPLASALAHEFDHPPPTAGVLPMLPNGTPAGSFRNPIPIRTIGDGMSESLGRLRREINKVRSPRLRPRPDSGMFASVPLEFDEEDEDFVGPGVGVSDPDADVDLLDVPVSSSSRETSTGDRDRDSGSGPTTVSTPATSEDDWDRKLEQAEDAWGGWSAQDKLAVEEVERYDSIDVVGLLDEEQMPGRQPVPVPVEGRRKGRARRRG